MANVLVEEQYLSDIASAIRTQNGLSTLYKPSEMMSGINDLRAREAWAIFNGTLDSKIAGSTVYEVSTSYLKPGAFIGYTAGNYGNILGNFNCSNVTSIASTYALYCMGSNASLMTDCEFTGQFATNNLLSEITLRSDISYIGGFMFNNCINLSVINFTDSGNLLKSINNYAFTGCSKLSTIANFPFSTSVNFASGCFYNTGIENLNINTTSNIGVQAFGNCSKLSSAIITASTLNYYAFASCKSLSFLSLNISYWILGSAFISANLSGEIYVSGSITNGIMSGAFTNYGANTFWMNITEYSGALNNITGKGCIGISAKKASSITVTNNSYLQWVSCDAAINANLNYNFNLQSVYFSTLSSSGTFTGCSNLTTVSLPNYAIISQSAFSGCSALVSISLSKATTLGPYAFGNCISLTDVYLPNVQFLNTGIFRSCYSLSTISFPNISYISANVFSYCSKLMSLYLMGSTVCKLSGTAAAIFSGCPIYQSSVNGNVYGSIYVPSSLYATYRASTNWTAISDRFVSM